MKTKPPCTCSIVHVNAFLTSIDVRDPACPTHGDARLAELDRPEVHGALADKLLDVLVERKYENFHCAKCGIVWRTPIEAGNISECWQCGELTKAEGSPTRCSLHFSHQPHDFCDGNPEAGRFGSVLGLDPGTASNRLSEKYAAEDAGRDHSAWNKPAPKEIHFGCGGLISLSGEHVSATYPPSCDRCLKIVNPDTNRELYRANCARKGGSGCGMLWACAECSQEWDRRVDTGAASFAMSPDMDDVSLVERIARAARDEEEGERMADNDRDGLG